MTIFSTVNTVVETALIDSSVIASFEVALAGVAIKLLTIINGNTDSHNLVLLNINNRPSSNRY
jgi:hypothetical protein